METLYELWNFVPLFSVLVFPQLFGILLFFRLKGRWHFLAHFLGFLTPIVLTVVFEWMIFMYRYYNGHPNDTSDGHLMGASLLILVSVALQFVVGLFAQLMLHAIKDLCAKKISVGEDRDLRVRDAAAPILNKHLRKTTHG